MYGVLQRQEEYSGSDYQERLMLSFDQMFGREIDSPLGITYRLWRERCSPVTQMPDINDFDYKQFLPDNVSPYISWIEMRSEDPLNYVLHDHTNQTGFVNHSDRPIGEHPCRMNGKACAKEYMICVNAAKPFYHEINQSFGTLRRRYTRILLPLSDKGGSIVKMIYGIRILEKEGGDLPA